MCYEWKICILGHPQTLVRPLPPRQSQRTYIQFQNNMVRVSEGKSDYYWARQSWAIYIRFYNHLVRVQEAQSDHSLSQFKQLCASAHLRCTRVASKWNSTTQNTLAFSSIHSFLIFLFQWHQEHGTSQFSFCFIYLQISYVVNCLWSGIINKCQNICLT